MRMRKGGPPANRATMMRDPRGRFAWGGGATVAGMGGIFWFGGGGQSSCLIVGDTAGNSGLLCCVGLGLGAVNGFGVSGQATSAVCPTCETICDMESGSVQVEAFGAGGAGVGGGGGASVGMNNATIFASGGIATGVGGGAIVSSVSCKLVFGGKNCKGGPLSRSK